MGSCQKMNNLELEIVSRTTNGGAHVKLNDNNENLGILYLDNRQLEVLTGILTVGSFNKEVEFTVKDPFEGDSSEDIFGY
jgi:hypothetical protein